MLTTNNNQYLRPEYLSPLPTTLDAKKSPLALLAQTCSNIGADNPNHKPLMPTLEKSKDVDKSKERSSEEKSSFKPYESSKKEDKSSDNERKTPTSKSGTPATGNTTPSGNGSVGPCGKSTPSSDTPKSESSSVSNCNSGPTSQNTLSGLGYGSTLGLDLARGDPSAGKDSLSLSHLGLSAYKGALNNAMSPLVNCAGCTPVGGPIPVDAASTGHTFPPSIATQSGISPLKHGSYSALSPYVGYARVKTASGGTTLVPVCRDPYCTNCQFSLQSAQLSSCPGGCTQCTHDRLVGPPPGLPGLVPNLASSTSPGGAPGMPGLNSQLYPPSVLARPNVCSWMVGDTYCGKRFSTSEELLQHLRTHTNLSATDGTTTLPVFSPTFTMSPAGFAACHLHYSSAPSLTTQAGLRRTYPTSLSPVSGLSASRYHPYKPSIPAFPTAPLPSLPHPSLGMYYSPYSLYGQRLGPPVHP